MDMEEVQRETSLWRFVVRAETDKGTPFRSVEGCPEGLEIQGERIAMLRADCTFTEACERIAETVPAGDMWVLQAPGVALLLSEAQKAMIAGLVQESVICLSAFKRNNETGIWSIVQSAAVNQFAWIGLNSSLLRGIRSGGKIRDKFACINFSYCLRQEKKLKLMNPCYSFVTCIVSESPDPMEEDESDSFADVVFEQEYVSDAPTAEYSQYVIDCVEEGVLRVTKRSICDETGIPWMIEATRAPPPPASKLYLPLGPEAERARLEAESETQQKKLLMKPIYLFSRILRNDMRDEDMRCLISSVSRIGMMTPTATSTSTRIHSAHKLHELPLFRREASLVFECAASPEALRLTSEHLQALGIRVTRASMSLPTLGFALPTSEHTPKSLGFTSHGTCSGEDMILAELLHSKQCLVGGTYVDVGCGFSKYSNTSNLAQRAGWRGICIDILDDVVSEMAARPAAIALKAYVSRQDDETKTICIPNSSDLRRFTSSPQFEWKDKRGTNKVSVSTRSLWSILCEHMVPISPVHLLNITCEGEDVHVLHGANISVLRPLIISVLFKSDVEFNKERDLLTSLGYILHRKLLWIAIFINCG